MGIARKIRGDEFYSQMIKLVVPIVIQNILNAAISSADVVMLKFVGQSAISAVSLATQYANILFSVFFDCFVDTGCCHYAVFFCLLLALSRFRFPADDFFCECEMVFRSV